MSEPSRTNWTPQSTVLIPASTVAGATDTVPLEGPYAGHLTLSPEKITRALLWITAVFAGIHVLTKVATVYFPDFPGRNWLVIMFGLGGEANLPATFSGGLLLLSAALLGTIALTTQRAGGPFSRHWAVLAGVFLFLCLDELAAIHDNISAPLSRLAQPGGALLYLWVVPYGLAVLLLLLASVRFLLHLPAATRRLFVLAGAMYVGGALGLELIEAASDARGIHSGFIPLLGVAIEETMEMLGLVVFISALFGHIRRQLPGLDLHLSVTSGPSGSTDS
ncbi:hypothetical protein [Deinococcus aerophilus]|uniref:Multidrug transporter n=1 Tax=Deinococcus aerophilus TaxID=522488 RepID=A0ABQ2GR75_9DEIO|nr:hypothetical protein [Deinococcus aerophilus]GGM07770.1 hypothetical protein GCM10010841_15120 [Deinococcus aerophilus]